MVLASGTRVSKSIISHQLEKLSGFPKSAHFHILETCFGSNWKEVELVLHNDSALEWFTDSGKQLGGIEIKSSPEKMAAGPVSFYSDWEALKGLPAFGSMITSVSLATHNHFLRQCS